MVQFTQQGFGRGKDYDCFGYGEWKEQLVLPVLESLAQVFAVRLTRVRQHSLSDAH